MGKDQLNQFRKEETIMNTTREMGVPIPKVHQVKEVDGRAVMLLGGVRGKTVFQHLLDRPHEGLEIGVQFGENFAYLHSIPYKELKASPVENWLTPESEKEKELFSILNSGKHSFLHLDYHSLNVMLSDIGIIDWTNSTVGDYRFDIARTLSIVEVHGYVYFPKEVLSSFIKGWWKGYESKNGTVGELSH